MMAEADGAETCHAPSSDNGVSVITEDSKKDDNSALVQNSIAIEAQESAPLCNKLVSGVVHKLLCK